MKIQYITLYLLGLIYDTNAHDALDIELEYAG